MGNRQRADVTAKAESIKSQSAAVGCRLGAMQSSLRRGGDVRSSVARSRYHVRLHACGCLFSARRYACAWFELMLRAPIRREFTERFNSKPPCLSGTNSAPYLEIEETLANAHMLRKLRRTEPCQIVKAIEDWVKIQPPGYSDGLAAVSDGAFAEAATRTLSGYLAAWAIERGLDLGNDALQLSRLLPLEEHLLGACPVYTIDDLEEVGLAPGSVRLIHRMEVVETEPFARQLLRLNDAVRDDWMRAKEQIKTCLPRSRGFEKLKDWKPPTWSLRLRGGHRVHLWPPEAGSARWRAVAVGNHKEMGHG